MTPARAALALRVLLNPRNWVRNERTDPVFDAWLWGALERGVEIKPKSWLSEGNLCSVWIEGVSVWVENAPYADACWFHDGDGRAAASRITALRLRDAVAPVIAEHSRKPARFVPPPAP